MFEKFRKSLADTAKELPKEERKEFSETVQESETYENAKKEHLEHAQITQENFWNRLDTEKGTYTIEINGEKFELGPTLKHMSWNEIPAKLEELNKTLKPEEKPWRVPTDMEYKEIGNPISETLAVRTLYLSNKEWSAKSKKAKELVESLGFIWNKKYWSSYIPESSFSTIGYCWESNTGLTKQEFISEKFLVRLIR
jgi:hypothetical protein